ncbi:hypothetical protein LCGC14_1781400 [marine sediment metagenome]|uniref:Uncharacterized protein n=1 Tax=marine sediment metagenome TaxID=412755 RepID=A0A0F9GVG6_9ZZZZ
MAPFFWYIYTAIIALTMTHKSCMERNMHRVRLGHSDIPWVLERWSNTRQDWICACHQMDLEAMVQYLNHWHVNTNIVL